MGKIRAVAAAAAMVSALAVSGCVPDSGPEPAPTSSGPQCPANARNPDEVPAVEGATPEAVAASVVAAYNAWWRAGMDVARTADWQDAQLPQACLDQLAAANRTAFASLLFTTATAHPSWSGYFDAVQQVDAANIRLARDAPEAEPGSLELTTFREGSATANGTFLKFEAIYSPPAQAAAGADWAGFDVLQQWYVELVPSQGQLIINFIEHRDRPVA